MKRFVLLALGIASLSSSVLLQAQEAVGSERQRLEQLRRSLLSQSLKPSGLDPDLERLFRYEPPYPYNEDRGYHFLAAYAAGQMRSRQDSSKGSPRLKTLIDLAAGRNFDFGRWQLGIDGIANLIPEYNRIDGQWLGYELQLRYRLAQERSLILRSSNNYTLRSHQWFSENHLLLYYAPERLGRLVLSAGRSSRDSYHLPPEELYRSYYAGLPMGNSPIRDYSKSFVALRNSLALSPELHLTTALSWEDRQSQVQPSLQHHRRLGASAQVLIAPSSINRSPSGQLLPIGMRRELGLNYEQAFSPRTLDQTSIPYLRYQQAELFARGSFALSTGRWDFTALVGKRWDQELLDSREARYFSQLHSVGRSSFRSAWATLPSYFSGGEGWATLSINYLSPYFLLSRRHAVGNFLKMDEALHLKGLATQDGRQYLEAGYSLGWGELARLGFFAGYNLQAKQTALALRLSLPLLYLTSSWSERR